MSVPVEERGVFPPHFQSCAVLSSYLTFLFLVFFFGETARFACWGDGDCPLRIVAAFPLFMGFGDCFRECLRFLLVQVLPPAVDTVELSPTTYTSPHNWGSISI